MADSRDQVIGLLREAHSLELHRMARLREAADAASGAYRERLEAHVYDEHRHAARLQARVDELGGAPGLLEAGLGLVRGLVAAGLRLARRPVDVIEHVVTGSTSLQRPREQLGAEAFELAGYVALERVAAGCGDAETAALAREIQEDERRMLEALEDAVRELAGGHPVDEAPAEEPAEPEAAAVEPAPEPPERTVPEARQPEEDLVGAAEDPSPTVVRETARDAADEDAEVVAEFSEPGAEEGAGAEVHVDPPWEDYDGMDAAEIEDRLRDADAVLAAAVELYERNGRQRESVMLAAERAVAERSEPSPRT